MKEIVQVVGSVGKAPGNPLTLKVVCVGVGLDTKIAVVEVEVRHASLGPTFEQIMAIEYTTKMVKKYDGRII